MGHINKNINGANVYLLGNLAEVMKFNSKEEMKKYFGDKLHDKEYRVILPFDFDEIPKHKTKSGNTYKCTCKTMIECYQPYYGFDWYHGDIDCIFNKKHFLDKLIATAE